MQRLVEEASTKLHRVVEDTSQQASKIVEEASRQPTSMLEDANWECQKRRAQYFAEASNPGNNCLDPIDSIECSPNKKHQTIDHAMTNLVCHLQKITNKFNAKSKKQVLERFWLLNLVKDV